MTRILIVDDNPSVRAALRMCFKMKTDWIVCGEAGNGDAAIEMARSVKPDVVLLDYAMPVMNGLEAARILSALAPKCAILMYTMFASPDLSELARAAGVRAVLSKEVNGIGAVMEAIEAVAFGNAEALGAAGQAESLRV
jgi:DNA-binding NarL/FixJ family response regulator